MARSKGKDNLGNPDSDRYYKKILKEQDFDFTLVVYGESHFIGHLFWHINDSNHPDYNPEFEKALGQPILEVYQECDRAIKEIMDINPDATFIIFSNSGVGPNYTGRHFVGEVLSRLGYRPQAPQGETKKKSLLPAGDVFAVQRIEKLVGQRNIEKIKSFIPEQFWDKWTRKFLSMGSDWKDSIAFDIPGDNTGTIRINLKGREPKGIVEVAEYDNLCKKIADEFMELKNPDTGKCLVSEIVFPHKKYLGDHMADLPDIVIKWIDTEHIQKMISPKTGLIQMNDVPDARTGAHKDAGFFIAAGNGIKHVNGVKEKLKQGYNEDIAPTILKYMGLPIPADMDGKPFDDILQSDEVSQ